MLIKQTSIVTVKDMGKGQTAETEIDKIKADHVDSHWRSQDFFVKIEVQYEKDKDDLHHVITLGYEAAGVPFNEMGAHPTNLIAYFPFNGLCVSACPTFLKLTIMTPTDTKICSTPIIP